MRRVVPLSSLTPGRCFTLAAPPAPAEIDDHDGPGPNRVASVFSRSVLQADAVFKVVGPGDDGVEVVDAAGASGTLEAATGVVEVARQGYERLAQRVREGDGS